MAVDTQVAARLTFDAQGAIQTSFISYMSRKPEARDMVAVMDATYAIAK